MASKKVILQKSPPERGPRVVLAQTAPFLGDIERNLKNHLEWIEKAKAEKANLIIFPELSLTGYFLNDLTDEVAMGLDDPRLLTLISAARGISVVAGFVERARDHRVYNSSVFIENSEIRKVHRKVYLPTYGIFDEGRYLAPGEEFIAFDSSIGRVGMLICEDAWHLASSYLLFLQNVDFIICISASPGRGMTEKGEVSSVRSWDAVLEALSGLFQTYVFYCNRVGVEDGITFFGGSRVFDPFGTVIGKLDALEPAMLNTTVNNGALRRARLFAPMRRDEKPDLVLRQLKKITGEL